MGGASTVVTPIRPGMIAARRVRAGGRPRAKRMLLSSAGRRVALLRCFREAARELDIDLEVLACDLQPEWSAACVEADRAFAAPPATSDEFAGAMLELCRREGVELVVPTIDTELLAYARAARRFRDAGAHVAVSGPELVEMARDKLETARFFARAGVPTPRTAAAEEVVADDGADWRWPLMAKPRHGSSSRGLAVVPSVDELAPLVEREPYVVQELLRGREFTVNMYFDDAGMLRCAVPHERRGVRAGEVEKGVTTRHPGLCAIAHRVAAALDRPCGVLCFQALVDGSGAASVFEINARFGGGYPLAHRAGATFARWMLEERFGLPLTASDDWRQSVVMLRYDDAVFV